MSWSTSCFNREKIYMNYTIKGHWEYCFSVALSKHRRNIENKTSVHLRLALHGKTEQYSTRIEIQETVSRSPAQVSRGSPTRTGHNVEGVISSHSNVKVFLSGIRFLAKNTQLLEKYPSSPFSQFPSSPYLVLILNFKNKYPALLVIALMT